MFVIISLFGLISFLSCGTANPILSGIDVGIITMQGKKPTIKGQTEFPFMARLAIIDLEKKNQKLEVYRCGGVIISENAILTAGHCLSDPIKNPRVQIKVGFVHSELEKDSAQVRWMTKYIFHPGFSSECIKVDKFTIICQRDIAIIFVHKPFVFGPMVQKAILSKSDNVPTNTEGWILGWGMTNTGELSNMLQKARMRVVDRSSCQKLSDNIFIDDDMFCLLSDSRKSTNSRGDSGGPFVIGEIVYGITSFGFYTTQNGRRLSDPSKPTIVTNIRNHYEWIMEELKRDSRMIQEEQNSISTSSLHTQQSTSSGGAIRSHIHPIVQLI